MDILFLLTPGFTDSVVVPRELRGIRVTGGLHSSDRAR
jgi:hypothetical protein